MKSVASLCACIAAVAELVPTLAEALEPIVTDGPWRFTAVTDRLIRVEYDAAKVFVDDPTAAFLRSTPKGVWVNHTAAREDGWSQLSTARVALRYQSAGPPSAGTVEIAGDDGYRWAWGDNPEDGNLLGTARTLDGGAETLDLNCNHKVSPKIDNSEMHCAWGLVSRRGWAIVNDTGMPTWTDRWVAASRNSLDVSVLMHGLDFAGAMLDYFYASGAPPLPPRWAFGTMFTRWFNYDSDSVMRDIDGFESRSMPLDAWIFDMNWHQYGPWGSFTWNTNSFPVPQDTVAWIHGRDLPIGANMHEHDGVSTHEATYDKVCDILGCERGKNIPFDLYNKSFASAQEDIAVAAVSNFDGKDGLDFSWIDYQQGEYDHFQNTRIPKLNPTFMLNSLRFTDPARHGQNMRGMILSRWGGLGSHRFPLGFSGDQEHTWKGLAFLPYFTSTAANVAFNYWSHDTVGGAGALGMDYELSVRWVQMSAWSPVLRFHDKGQGTGKCAIIDVCARIIPWDVPSAFFRAIRRAAQERDELVPYIYTSSWQTASTGLALVRPMYYENPSDEALYGLGAQYLFGPDMVMSPIAAPSGPEAVGFEEAIGAVRWPVYAPKSARGWMDRLNGNFHTGKFAMGTYGINDVPGLVRQGAVVPMRPRFRGESSLARARMPLSALEFRIMPASAFYTGGTLSGHGFAVDDDGISMDYTRGIQTIFACDYNFSDMGFDIRVSSTGEFHGPETKTTLRLSFPQLPPLRVTAVSSGASIPTQYDHALLGTVVIVEQLDLAGGQVFRVEIDPAYRSALPNFVGALGRIRRGRYMKDAMDVANVPYGAGRANLTSYVLAATNMSPEFAAALPQLWQGSVEEVAKLLVSDATLTLDVRRWRFVAAMLADDVVVPEKKEVDGPSVLV